LLGCFLFSGDDVFKKIKVLSGGEKARVALAKVIAGKANFLLLDEPTNHLDIQSVELLIEALNQYEGTYILVSHDRYFVSRTANKYWEIENEKVVSFSGTYEEWELWKQEKLEKAKTSQAPPPTPKKQEVKKQEAKPVNNHAAQEKKKELQKQQKTFQKLEADLNRAEVERAVLEQQLADPEIYTHKDKFQETEQKYQDCLKRLTVIQKEYDAVFEKMLELEAEN
jgi:ATP-binding cassette subfamily F protein 3